MTYQHIGSSHMEVAHHFPIWLPQTQTWLFTQVNNLPTNIRCHILCDSTANLDQFDVPHIHCLAQEGPIQRLWEKIVRKLRLSHRNGFLPRQIAQNKVTLLHSHFGNVGWADIKVAKRMAVRHVVTFYGFDVHQLPMNDPQWQIRYQELFASADLFLCEGPYMADCLVAQGCPAEKVKVQHLGIQLDRIPFLPRQWNSTQPLKVLIAASFREKKGIPFGLAALGCLQRDIPIEITIIGDADNSASSRLEKSKIMSEIERYRFKTVRLLGYQPHATLHEEAYKHHLFMSPSITAADGDSEGGAPVTVIEMAATGMPVISSRHCDIPMIIKDKETGLLAEEKNIAELVEKIRWLLENQDRWRYLTQQARRHIDQEFNAVQQGQRLRALYESLH